MSKAAATRLNILQKAFELVYVKGYQATSIDEIIATTQVTKGAFFYHFKNKDEMGLAMINEVMYPGMYAAFVQPLLESDDAVEEIYKMMKGLLIGNPFFQVEYGCPAMNLIEELAPVNQEFKQALGKLTEAWQQTLETLVRNGKKQGLIRKDVKATPVAYFIMSGYSGIRNMGKIYGVECYHAYLKEFKHYLKSLR